MFFHPMSQSQTQFLLIAAAAATAAVAASLFFYSTQQAKLNKKKREKQQEQDRQKNPIYQAKEYIKKRTAEIISKNTLIQEYMKKRTAEIISNNTLIQVSKPMSPDANYHQNPNQNIDPVYYNIARLRQALEESSYEHEEKRWRSRVLVEYTPLGNIIMNYDVYRFGFSYYSDNNSLNYDLLNAVAMKYVKIFHCLDFFMDETFYDSPLFDVFFAEKKEDEKPSQDTDTTAAAEKKIDSNDDVFVKKPAQQKNQPPQKLHRKTEHKKRVNKFIKQGKIENFSFLLKPPNRPVFSVNKVEDDSFMSQKLFSYADYKNRQKQLPPPVVENQEEEEDYLPELIDI
jgi:L-rhamnose mutarotase